jgi:hypothetical protein
MHDAIPQDWTGSPRTSGTWLGHRPPHGVVAGDPRGSLARAGIALHVYDYPLRLPGKVVHGVWDPVLRRIELYACNDARADQELAATLGHELWHAFRPGDRTGRPGKVGRGRIGTTDEERQARAFAQAWLRRLGSEGVRVCARALRSQAVGRRPPPAFSEGLRPALPGQGEPGFCILSIAL